MLKERLARQRRHPRQPYHEIVEAMLDFWEDNLGWTGTEPCPPNQS
jgi:hypothetical protein